MDLYIKLEELSETVYDLDSTSEKIEESADKIIKSILNMADECWNGDAQKAFLNEFYKWINECNKFTAANKTVADYLADNIEKANTLLKQGQNLKF